MTLQALPHRCWELSHHPEQLGDLGEGWPHFADASAAVKHLFAEVQQALEDRDEAVTVGEWFIEEHPGLLESKPEKLPQPCWVLSCDICGAEMRWDGEKVADGTHWASRQDATDWVDDSPTWTRLLERDGSALVDRHLCHGCGGGPA